MSEDFGTAVVDAANAVDSTSAASSDSPSATSTNNDSATQDFAVEAAPVESEENLTTQEEEIDPNKEDGTPKTEEEISKEKAEESAKSSTGKDQTPAEIRTALKKLRDSAPDDPKTAAAVKQLHGAYERWEAAKTLLGTGEGSGIVGLKNLLAENNAKDITELRTSIQQHTEMANAVNETDSLLHKADPLLAENVFADMKAQGSEKNYGKVVSNFVTHLKTADPDSFYENVAKPLTLAGMDEAQFPQAINSLHKALTDGDVNKAKAITRAIAGFYTGLRDELSESAKISKERAAWEAERAEGEKATQTAESKKQETEIATSADKFNNTRLGKSLGAFLKLPYFKDFPRETLVDLGNGIKETLYARLKADKDYQNSMAAFFKNPTKNREAMLKLHESTVDRISDEVVRTAIQKRYPGYAKGGSAAGKAAVATAAKANATKAANQSVSTGKPIYVAARPENLIRSDVRIGGRTYTSEDLRTLQVSGKGFVKSSDGKSVKFITWRR